MLSDDFKRAAAAAARLAVGEKDIGRKADYASLAAAFQNLADGPVVQTPDGVHTYRLGVANDGTFTSTLVT